MFAALQVVEKVTLVNKMEQFDRFFEKGFRKRASLWMPISVPGNMDWADLQNLHAGRTMSPDLLAYFILKQKGLSKDYRRQILLSTGSAYDLNSIERFKNFSYYNIHEREKRCFFLSTREKVMTKCKKYYANLVED